MRHRRQRGCLAQADARDSCWKDQERGRRKEHYPRPPIYHQVTLVSSESAWLKRGLGHNQMKWQATTEHDSLCLQYLIRGCLMMANNTR